MNNDKLMELLDKQALHEVVCRYCRAVDRSDGELFLSCYHPDAHDEHGPYSGSPTKMLAALQAKGGPMAPGAITVQHAISNELFDVQGDVAYGEIYFETRRTGSNGELLFSIGRYVDRYEKRNGEWRIAYRRCVMEYARKGTNAAVFPQGSRDRTDPSYERKKRG